MTTRGFIGSKNLGAGDILVVSIPVTAFVHAC